MKKRFPKRSSTSFKDYIKFMLIALMLLVVVDQFLLGGERSYINKIKQDYAREQAQKQAKEKQLIEELLPPEIVYPQEGEYFEALPTGKPKIAIVIDDLGMNMKWSKAAIELPPEITLAILPYAKTARDLAKVAQEKGHELIIHAPMEALSKDVSLGTMALRGDMDFAAFDAEFKKMMASFDGFVGVNNHMGSKLTQDEEAMGYLMDQLKQQALYFLDSLTINTSVAAHMAKLYGVPYVTRDVFLDHEEKPEFIRAAMQKTEDTARRKGYAIAIAHPKEMSIQLIMEWVETLPDKGFELVPISTLVK